MMKLLLLPLLGLLLLTGARAQQDVDVEGLREVLSSLVSSGQPVTSESLTSISGSFSGVEKDLLTRYTVQLENANEAAELFLNDEITDLESFKTVLYNLKALKVTVRPNLPEALLRVIDDPARQILQPFVTQWKKANAVSLTDALKNSIIAAIDAIKQVLNGSNGSVIERLQAKISTLSNGMPKSVLVGIKQILEKLEQKQGSFSFTLGDEEQMMLPAAEIQEDVIQVNKVLNREIIRFLSTSMLKMNKAQIRDQVELLLTKIYDNEELPAVLNALIAVLK